MSSTGQAKVPTTAVITGNPALDGLILKGIGFAAAALTGVILTWLNAHGFNDPNLNLMLSGAVVSILTMAAVALWGWINSKVTVAQSVQAGINLQAAGGGIMQRTDDGKLTPKPVTISSADQILKDFGKVRVKVAEEAALTDKMNAESAEIVKDH